MGNSEEVEVLAVGRRVSGGSGDGASMLARY